MIFSLSEDKRFLIIDKCSELELEQLNISLNKRIKSWRFNPLVKRGVWDGYVSYIKNDKYIPAGLWKEVYDIAKKFQFEIQFKNLTHIFDKNIDQDDFTKWAVEFFDGHELTPRDYQIETAFRILKFRKCMAELATSAGKTLISFLVVAYMIEKGLANRLLFIVPNVSLVLQATEDFQDYNLRNRIKLKIQQIYAGKKLRPNKNLIIGTYQSLIKKDKEFFSDFDAVVVDETHKAKAASIKTILSKCTAARYRFGLSGTIPKPGTLDRLTLMSYTGPLINEVNASFLQGKGHIAKCKVSVLEMDYAPDATKQAFAELADNRYDRKKVFGLECNYIINSDERLNFITNVIEKTTKNSLVLFYRIEHGEKIYERLRQTNKQVYYVDGGTDKEIREAYKSKMEGRNDVILVASFGTFSTGISIKNIHNIFFTESFKSEIIIRQSIGRGLRLHKEKDVLSIVDFVDNFCYDGWKNYLYKHGDARQKIYKEQKFPYDVKKVNF